MPLTYEKRKALFYILYFLVRVVYRMRLINSSHVSASVVLNHYLLASVKERTNSEVK